MPPTTRLLIPFCLTVCLAAGSASRATAGDDVQVALVAILATSDAKNPKVDAGLENIARRVQKKYPDLTRFHMAQMTSQSVTVGRPETFKLVDDQSARVVVEQAADKNDHVRLTVTPPELRAITYTTCCGKYFPIVTPYHTKKQEQLIMAIMVSPCKEE
jgi:hypothetical protein